MINYLITFFLFVYSGILFSKEPEICLPSQEAIAKANKEIQSEEHYLGLIGFENSVSFKKFSLGAKYPDLQKLIIEQFDLLSFEEVRKLAISRFNPPGEPTLGMLLETGSFQMNQSAQKILDYIKDIKLTKSEKETIEKTIKQIFSASNSSGLAKNAKKFMSIPYDPFSDLQKNYLFLATRKPQTLLGELRVGMVVRDFDMMGATVDQIFERLKILAKNSPDPNIKSKGWVQKVDEAYQKIPENLKFKEVDITTLPTSDGILIGEVKTFERPLQIGSYSWNDVTSQIKKQNEIATVIEGLGVKVKKVVYFINGVTPEAKIKLEKEFGVEVVGKLIPVSGFIPKPESNFLFSKVFQHLRIESFHYSWSLYKSAPEFS